MKDHRYLELKKENNENINKLTQDYQNVINIYCKKARDYGIKSEDTEIKIREVIKEVLNYSNAGLPIIEVIPIPDRFIGEKLQLISKRNDHGKVKNIILTTIVVIFFVSWILVGFYMKRPHYLEEPQNLRVVKVSQNRIEILWDSVEYANNGYFLYWKKGEQDELEISIESGENKYIMSIEPGSIYTFSVKAKATDIFGESLRTTITYEAN